MTNFRDKVVLVLAIDSILECKATSLSASVVNFDAVGLERMVALSFASSFWMRAWRMAGRQVFGPTLTGRHQYHRKHRNCESKVFVNIVQKNPARGQNTSIPVIDLPEMAVLSWKGTAVTVTASAGLRPKLAVYSGYEIERI